MYRMNGKRVGRPILLLDVCREFRSPKRWISLFTPLSSLPLVLQARLSFFPRYYLVSTPLCHGSTKFEAFIECLRTEDRPQPPPRLQASFSLSLSHSVPISLSLAPHSPSFSLSIFLSSCPPSSPQCIYPTKASGSVCTVMPRGRNFQCVSPSVIQVCALAPDFPCKGTQVCAALGAMHAVFQIFRRDTWGGGERERERGRETTGSNCQPGYAVRSILVKFFIRRVSLAHLLARRLISGRER